MFKASTLAGIAVVFLLGGMFYHHRIHSILSGDYDRVAVCEGGWWINRAANRETHWATIRTATSTEVLTVPAFRFRACIELEGDRLLSQARSQLNDALTKASDAAYARFADGLPTYLDARYDGGALFGDTMTDAGRTLEKFFDGWQHDSFKAGLSSAWNESGSVHRDREAQRLDRLYDPPVAEFNAAISSYFSDYGPCGSQLSAYPSRLLGGVVRQQVAYVSAAAADPAAIPRFTDLSAVQPQPAVTLSAVPLYALGVAGDATAQRLIVGRSAAAGLGRVAAATIVMPFVIATIDEKLNRRKVETQRRVDMESWLSSSRSEVRTFHLEQVRNHEAAVRAWLLTSALGEGLVVSIQQ